MIDKIDKAPIIMEVLPYIKKFKNKTFVIKYGGSIMKNEVSKEAFMKDIVLLKMVGINVVIVHGGGPEIAGLLRALEIPSEFVEGLRVTTKETMEVVEMVLSGKVNKEITSRLCSHGIEAVGISGRDSHLMTAQKKYVMDEEGKIDIGFVGDVEKVNEKFLRDLLQMEYLPVVSPVGCDMEGNPYNINADHAASAISSAIKAEKLIILTDVKGLYKDIDQEDSFISSITIDEIKEYIHSGVIKGGMIPKMECCIEALENGTKNIHLIDGRKEHSLLLEILLDEGIGTMIKGGC